MLSASNIDVLDTLRLIKSYGLSCSFLVPTHTGMDKSIMDATAEVREFLSTHNLHNYSLQKQGPENKILLRTIVLSKNQVEKTQTALYRPNTKTGDPRIWIHGLKKLALPGDLLALINTRNGLVIINCSQSQLDDLLNPAENVYKNILVSAVMRQTEIAKELLEKIRHIHQLGYIQTKRKGDTGVGYTLETLLEIKANSSKKPDYKGIEIKSKRSRGSTSKTTVFSQVPNWSLSRLKSSKELLYERGYYSEKEKRIQLNHTLSATKSNSLDLKLRTDPSRDQLQQIYTAQSPFVTDVLWDFSLLKERLASKHKETFWITADTHGKNGDETESFWYKKIKHTSSLDESAFPILLDLGVITLDYLIKEKPQGGVKDHGYLFKINPKNLDLLFKQVHEYDLDI